MSKVNRKRIKANRMNAKKSTGPKTPEGKAISKMNALKHGILADVVVLKNCSKLEAKQQFNRILSDLTDELRPIGFVEEMLVEQIAVSYWRQRRVIRKESGDIAKRIEDHAQWSDEDSFDSVSLPTLNSAHLIIRYETTFERRINRALSTLLLLQQRRYDLEKKDTIGYTVTAIPAPPASEKNVVFPNEPNSLESTN